MTRDRTTTTEPHQSQGKPFPWQCPECGKKDVRPATVRHTSQVKHDGRLYTVEVPTLRVPQCGNCRELLFDNDADEQIAQALRDQLGLLSGEQIRKSREDLGLSQRTLADHLGVAVETISRWENSALTQTRAMDRYLRVYFGVPAARAALVEQTSLSHAALQVKT
jgi:putative zinc finger/helix-turn-helix YgiT family protein